VLRGCVIYAACGVFVLGFVVLWLLFIV